MKRFYHVVAVEAAAGGHAVTLDGKTVRTPMRQLLVLPTGALAAAVAGEWDDQVETVRPETMPLSRFANTALDRVQGRRDVVIDQIAATGGADLLCYRAEHPESLRRRQSETWQPLLDWSARELDAPLTVTAGVVPVAQPVGALAALRTAVAAHDAMALTALHAVAAAAGSLVIALALAAGRIDAEAAVAASQLDEIYQAEQWGEDGEAGERRRAVAAEIAAAARFHALLGKV